MPKAPLEESPSQLEGQGALQLGLLVVDLLDHTLVAESSFCNSRHWYVTHGSIDVLRDNLDKSSLATRR